MTTCVAFLPTLIPMMVFLWLCGSDGGVFGNPQETTTEMVADVQDRREECAGLNETAYKTYYFSSKCVKYTPNPGNSNYSYTIQVKYCPDDFDGYNANFVPNDFTDEQWRMIPVLRVRHETIKFYTNEGRIDEAQGLCATIHLTDDGSNDNYTDFTITRDQVDPCNDGTGFDYLCIVF